MILALAAALLLALVAGPVQPKPPVLENETVSVMRYRLSPGEGFEFPASRTPQLVVYLSKGVAEIRLNGESNDVLRNAGDVTFVPKGQSYAAKNTGMSPFDVLTIWINPARPAAAAAPPTEAPPGITRTTLVDNSDVRVVRVRFAPGSREPIHTHPNDLLTVQLTAGTLEMSVGAAQASGQQPVGFTTFLPRNVPHAYISKTELPFELLSISIK